MKLLLIEDEKRLAQALTGILRLENYEVDHCADGIAGLQAVDSGVYDIIILDVMLPGMDGFKVAENARKCGVRTPILMLTAKGDLDGKVAGLDIGADDYLTKSFKIQELLARLRALGRRSIHSPDVSLSFGDIRLDAATSTLICTANEQSVWLSEKEFRILEYLNSNQGQILRREQLAVKIWGFDSDAEYNNVEVYMSFTRKKLAFVGSQTRIKAVRGIGYELRCTHV